MKTSVWRLF